MAVMFDSNFSFDTPRSPSLDSSTAATRSSSRSVSPCSPVASPLPLPRLSVTDLASQFAAQRLRRQSQICYDDCNDYANNDGNEAGWSIPSAEAESFDTLSRTRTRPHSPSSRAQRQLNTRLLCSTSHHRDIAALVARMVESNDQCSISTSPTLGHEDEGYSSTNDEQMVGTTTSSSRRSSLVAVKARPDYRRSSDYVKGTGVCVNKNVRFRKGEKPRRVRSDEEKRA